MKSKSFNARHQAIDQTKEHKSFDFVKLYQSAAENKAQFESTKSKKLKKSSQPELDTSTISRSPKKNKKKDSNESMDISQIDVDELSSSHKKNKQNIPLKASLSSTPNSKGENTDSNVKSIIKNKSDIKEVDNVSNISSASSNPKKRNKSVSFMLEEAEQVVVKRSKTNDTSKEQKEHNENCKNKQKLLDNKYRHKKTKKEKKLQDDNMKENVAEDYLNDGNIAEISKKEKRKASMSHTEITASAEMIPGSKEKVKKAKKNKGTEQNIESVEDNGSNIQDTDNKLKKLKKKKRKAKSHDDNLEADGEPAVKARKKDLTSTLPTIKPEAIAKGLENLNIGDNAHTLTNLIDEMTVVDKKKKKKDKKNINKMKKLRLNSNVEQDASSVDTVRAKEEHAKEKWSKRKWNKDRGVSTSHLLTSVIVENLPIRIMCSYKTLLSDYFGKFGTISGIGVAEAYPTEDPRPVFTTTVYFQEEEAATKALEEDNASFEGARIRVRRPPPPALSTLVVRTRAAATDQAVSSLFSAAGRVRRIRHCVKGKGMSTTFVEFDGPEAVERAIQLAQDAKMCGKKVFTARYVERRRGDEETDGHAGSNNDDGDH